MSLPLIRAFVGIGGWGLREDATSCVCSLCMCISVLWFCGGCHCLFVCVFVCVVAVMVGYPRREVARSMHCAIQSTYGPNPRIWHGQLHMCRGCSGQTSKERCTTKKAYSMKRKPAVEDTYGKKAHEEAILVELPGGLSLPPPKTSAFNPCKGPAHVAASLPTSIYGFRSAAR